MGYGLAIQMTYKFHTSKKPRVPWRWPRTEAETGWRNN